MRFGNLIYAKRAVKNAGAPWGMITSATGFVGDVLKPAGNLAPYLLILSILGTFITGFFFRKKAKQVGVAEAFGSTLGSFFAFFFLSMFAWVALTAVSFSTPEEGLMASSFPEIANFQKYVLKIGVEAEAAKQSAHRLEEKIDFFAERNALFSNPKQPAEFYQNARLYELQGNTNKAIEFYQSFLELEPSYVDAHEAYQDLIKATKGEAFLKSFYQKLQSKYPDNPIVAIMALRLETQSPARVEKFRALTKRFPQVGPVVYELVIELLYASGDTTLEEMQECESLLKKFSELNELGFVKRYYLNKKKLSLLYARQKEFETQFEQRYRNQIEKAFDLKFKYFNNEVQITLVPYEDGIQKIYFSIDTPTPDRETGTSKNFNPVTQKTAPNYTLRGQLPPGKHTLYIQYINAKGQKSQIIEKAFEIPFIYLAYTVSEKTELIGNEVTYHLMFFSLDGPGYEYFYGINEENPKTKVEKTAEYPAADQFDVKLKPGEYHFYYYGIKNKIKTPVGHFLLKV